MGEHKAGATVLMEDSLRIQGIGYEKNEGTRAEVGCLGLPASKATFLKNNFDAHVSVSLESPCIAPKELDFISKEWLQKHELKTLFSFFGIINFHTSAPGIKPMATVAHLLCLHKSREQGP